MHIRSECGSGGWIRAGLAVLVTGILGGGVLTVARDTSTPGKVTADGVAAPRNSAAADKPLDLSAGPAPAGEAPKADPVVGDKVDVGSDGGSVTVMAVEDNVSAGRLFGAGPGQKYWAAEVKGCAGPHEKNIVFDPGWFMVRLDDGTMRDHGPGAKKPELDGGPVPAGKCLSGWVTFTVPDGAYATGVLYDGSSRLVWTVPLPKGAHPTTTTTGRAGAAPATPSTTEDGPATTSTTTRAKSTTTTTARAATEKAAKAAATTTTTGTPTGKAAATTTTTGGSKSTTTTTGKSPTPTTTGPKATTTTTSGALSSAPAAPGE
ncbi:MAG TPA: hypothetical protein VFE55_11920 [Acidimicrobiia bacterium]|nr:hypothetical protein [Acidimicrobiia bacterium]